MSGLSKTLSNKVSLSQLVLVDMQTKLAPAMAADEMQIVAQNAGILAQAANLLNVPMLCTEQYPKGLGHTLPAIAQHLGSTQVIAKTEFSCVSNSQFKSHLRQDHPQIILAGIEAHICVLQTALDLTAIGKQVFVVEDAVASRKLANKHNALARLRDAGCIITNTESVVFEWLGKAGGDAFKAISQLIR